jgi:hypothetical protein
MNAPSHLVRSTFDHWWPRGLQSYWKADDGYITISRPDGSSQRKKPGKGSKIAGRQRGHEFVVRGQGGPSPWDHSFEPIFDRADNSVHDVIRHLTATLPTREGDPILVNSGDPRDHFFSNGVVHSYVTLDELKIILELIFSLLYRNPHFRDVYASAGRRMGLPRDPMTGQLNIQHKFRWIQDTLKHLFRINVHLCLLYAESEEFVYGDGLYTTLDIFCPVIGDTLAPLVKGRALVPLTPETCLLLKSAPRDIRGPNVHSVYLRKSEVTAINRITQAMSAEFIFSRKPDRAIYSEFGSKQHGPLEECHLQFISGLCTIAAPVVSGR